MAEMVKFAASKKLYLGCNLNHYFTEPAARAKQYMADGMIGETIYLLFKMGFNGGEEIFKPTASSRFKGFPYAHLKAFLTHPFSVMRYFCGDITHLQAFVDRPSFRRHTNDLMLSIASIHVRFENGCVGYLLSQRGDSPFGLGGWWSFELSGTRGAFCIENCIEKFTFWPAPTPTSCNSGPDRQRPSSARHPAHATSTTRLAGCAPTWTSASTRRRRHSSASRRWKWTAPCVRRWRA